MEGIISCSTNGSSFADPAVYLGCGSPLHLASHMGVDIQCGAAGDMADDRRKGFHIAAYRAAVS